MEVLKQARRAARFTVDRFRGGGYAELAARYAPEIADMALQDTIEFDPVQAEVIDFPHGLKLKNPPGYGRDLPPAA